MAEPNVVVVIPCHNEAKRLRPDVFLNFVRHRNGFRFLFVDDGSQDDTSRVLESIRREAPERFSVLRLADNSGKAEAIRRGFLSAFNSDVQYLAYWDADLATPLEVLPEFLDIFARRPEVEMVFGARVKLMGRDIERRLLRHYLGRVFATCASIVLRLSIYDTQCGAKMFRITAPVSTMFKDPFCSSWIFDVELLARFTRLKRRTGETDLNASIYELPLPSWHDVKGSKVKAIDFVKAFWELLRIYWIYRP